MLRLARCFSLLRGTAEALACAGRKNSNFFSRRTGVGWPTSILGVGESHLFHASCAAQHPALAKTGAMIACFQGLGSGRETFHEHGSFPVNLPIRCGSARRAGKN